MTYEPGPKHYEYSKIVEIFLEKFELAFDELNPGFYFHIGIHNISEKPIELDRIFYTVYINIPTKEEKIERRLLGKGYTLVKDIIDSKTKRGLPLLFELPHYKIIVLHRLMKEARSPNGILSIMAYFSRLPERYQALQALLMPLIEFYAYSEAPSTGWITRQFEFKIPIDEWENFVEKIKEFIS